MIDRNKAWEEFNKRKTTYLKWPNETMVKALFGNYFTNKVNFVPEMNVLDVGCGFGNNLRPFLDLGYNCCGTEVTKKMAQQTQDILKENGFNTTIREGFNTSLPFEDDTFDILLSINVIHYEKNKDDIKNAFKEYQRVLKKGGILFLSTTGENHVIKCKAELLDNGVYKIKDHDFRDGSSMYFFDNDKYLELHLSNNFENIEIGKVGEYFDKSSYEYFISVSTAK